MPRRAWSPAGAVGLTRLARAHREADPRRRGARRREQRCGHGAGARERLARRPLGRGAPRGGCALGADVPFFLGHGAKLATGDGTELEPVELPTEYSVVLVLPHGATKESTGAVYAAFDERKGATGSPSESRAREALATVQPRDLAAPANDLASSPLAAELEAAGAFRADVGAGPTVYGLFESSRAASEQPELAIVGRTIVTRPVGASRSRVSGKMTLALGRGQVVRQRVLVP